MSNSTDAGPPVEDLELHEQDLEEKLLPRLVGSIFHVTSRVALQGIRRDGAIRQNQSGTLGESYPQSRNSYGRQQGYVSLFNLRTVPDGELESVLTKFYFLNPGYTNNQPVFLFLGSAAYGSVIPWTQAGPGEMLIPHAEGWYPGDLQLDLIRRILQVKVLTDPPSDHLLALRETNRFS